MSEKPIEQVLHTPFQPHQGAVGTPFIYVNLPPTAGVKFDGEKIRPELFPPEAFEALCELYARGAKKYGDRNWERGMSWSRMFGALMRHAWAWMRRESYDSETKAHHMLAVAFNAIAIYTYETRKIGTDDRPN